MGDTKLSPDLVVANINPGDFVEVQRVATPGATGLSHIKMTVEEVLTVDEDNVTLKDLEVIPKYRIRRVLTKEGGRDYSGFNPGRIVEEVSRGIRGR